MTIPFWCLFIVCLVPYVWAPFSLPARRQQLGSVDNKNPRAQQALLTGRGARAVAAHKNAFEAIATFAPAVVVAHLAQADPVWSARLAETFVVARIAHGVLYLADLDLLRSLSFGVAMACTVGLFVLAIQAG
ncbi:MAG TPA: MAPEG family protein [Myxococcota bacterium]|nr:MAPEG family protein [Myxococcota bacterium]